MSARVLPFPSTPLPADDAALLQQCAKGDEHARTALYDRFHAPVFRYCARACGQSAEDVEDLVQATFIEVFRSVGKFSARSQVLTWILGIAANLTRHEVRRRIRRDRFLSLLGRQPEPVSPHLEKLTLLKEGMVRLEEALRGIPLDSREVFILCEVEGLKGADAAAILNVPEGTVWRRLHKARTLLREALEEVRP